MARIVLPVPARPSRATTLDVGVEQQLEREPLLLRAGPQAPRLGRDERQQHERRRRAGAPAPTASRRAARRTRSRASAAVAGHRVDGDARPRGVEAVDALVRRLDGDPARSAASTAGRAARVVLGGLDAEVGRLDAQRGVVGDDARRRRRRPGRGRRR